MTNNVVRHPRFTGKPRPSGNWFTKRQLAERLQVSTRTVDRWVAKGLPEIRDGEGAWRYVGSRRRFIEQEVLAWLARTEVEEKASYYRAR